MDLITVIIPVYEVEKYLKKCVDSVLGQTYTELEIFLVDDGSPDGCPAICDEYAAMDSRVKVIHKQNGGLSDARNVALDVMTGEYVTFVDSDDYIAPDAIETMYSALTRNHADIAVGNMESFNENSEPTGFVFPPTKQEIVYTGRDLLKLINQPSGPNKLYKSELFRSLRFPKGKLYEDLHIWHKHLQNISSCVMTGKTAYYYLIRSESIMHANYTIRNTDDIEAFVERYEWLDSIGEHALANENRMFIYANYAKACAKLDKSIPEHSARLAEIKKIYSDCCSVLLKDSSVSSKQKLRLFVLRFLPKIHYILFG